MGNTLPEGGVTVFGSLLHSHLRGVSMSLRHVRDGVELEPVDVNEHYDFNYQQVIFHDESRELLPGDQLILHCSYDTTGDDNMIFGGEGTNDEMCAGALYVYPAPDFLVCLANPSWDTRSQWLNDAYDLGLWDVNVSAEEIDNLSQGLWATEFDRNDTNFVYNVSGVDMADLIEWGVLGEAADLDLEDWTSAGGHWNGDVDGAAAFYQRLWDNDDGVYYERDSMCVGGSTDDVYFDMTETTFNDEFGDFEEYCDDTCGCETATTSVPTSSPVENGSTGRSEVVLIVATVAAVISIY